MTGFVQMGHIFTSGSSGRHCGDSLLGFLLKESFSQNVCDSTELVFRTFCPLSRVGNKTRHFFPQINWTGDLMFRANITKEN